MKKALLLCTTGVAVALAMLAFGFVAGNPQVAKAGTAQPAQTAQPVQTAQPAQSAVADTKIDRAEVEGIIRDYLLKNPEVLLEVQDALEAKQKEEQRLAALGVIKNAKDQIFNSTFDGVVGNPNGKVTIVEFYDYNCGFCKRAIEDMRALTKSDPDLRFVLKEFPILGPDSQKASVVSMAFHLMMPEKYGEFHNALLGGQGRATEATAIKIALSLGADEATLREKMKDASIPEAFSKTYDLANKLQITGTPSYVVGNEVVFGALGQEVLAEKIEAAKAAL
ncbi:MULTISPECIES: DsbA family protein [unclassified Mesorhizobium]|uniref:DsbA family protein n=1 Tax=unclassified Mesorhizobium TaxID=325217 RepID=UPI000FDC8CCE|nr:MULTISPECIES: DsbA family protein [unclassified Mesorhizobium]TGR58163.1 DsbA family protein [bacterium M00.F.Ca.ET.199.01.1.1]TGU41731.1 DsbA family protein [bacterium M00.F.Ca.ET.156.01.1.1]TGV89644.1 DsbA family protein [Mesorhizobium sp. M00.F.Ca.ET.149.01.1.1]TGR32904.1 DsbA family protein [Mesorhizobium sp. M8A.F.Ca.ET.197.01.1.1]TGR34551.1 DsbA family protein [Mesorhizobium sp. M8A.F.Ca.ET.202.01.1.1]